jgi:predicted CXXCH cytochrome family protein
MRGIRFLLTLAAIAVAAAGFNAYAFHSGGVAECEGCHSMHTPTSPSKLLVGSDGSSACLTCHDNTTDTLPNSYHISTSDATGGTANLTGKMPIQRTPGGDFGWLKKEYSWVDGTETIVEKDSLGHNIIAADFGYAVDGHWTASPGGAFPSSQLGCQSCHDPHGKARRLNDGTYAATGAPIVRSGSYNNSADPAAGQAVGVYRLLYAGVSPDKPTNTNFTSVAVAVAPSAYNRTEAVTQTRVAYGGGTLTNSWGSWCGGCHGAFNTMNQNLKHPIDVALDDLATTYANYVSSGISNPANASTSYLSVVPFAEATEDYAILRSHALNSGATQLIGPSSSDAVTCLSCHRAHASGFGEMLRFYYGWEFMTYDGKYPGLDNTSMGTSRRAIQARGRNMADHQAAYYDRAPTFVGPYNRVLCNKCHGQD